MFGVGSREGERNIKDDSEVCSLMEFLSTEVKEFAGGTGLYGQD